MITDDQPAYDSSTGFGVIEPLGQLRTCFAYQLEILWYVKHRHASCNSTQAGFYASIQLLATHHRSLHTLN